MKTIKNNLKNKKFLSIVLCMLILISISIVIYLSDKKTREENIKHDETIGRLTEEYEKKEDSKETLGDIIKEVPQDSSETLDLNNDKVIEKLFINISDLINSDDFTNIYKYYNEKYIDEFKVTEEQLKDKFKFSKKITAKVTTVKRDKLIKDRVVVTVRLIDEYNAERIFDFTVFNDGSIADIPLYKEIELNKLTKKDNILYTVKKKFITRLGSIFIINIENNSEYLLDIQDIKGVLGTSFKYDHELINGNKYSYKITPEKSVDLIVKIFNQEKPDDIIITNKRYDGTLESYSILKN